MFQEEEEGKKGRGERGEPSNKVKGCGSLFALNELDGQLLSVPRKSDKSLLESSDSRGSLQPDCRVVLEYKWNGWQAAIPTRLHPKLHLSSSCHTAEDPGTQNCCFSIALALMHGRLAMECHQSGCAAPRDGNPGVQHAVLPAQCWCPVRCPHAHGCTLLDIADGWDLSSISSTLREVHADPLLLNMEAETLLGLTT